MNIEVADIIRIFNKIARTYPKSKCGGIRGFATIDDGSVFEGTSNAGKMYSDYLNGQFWAYDWEKGGADPNELCLEYPALGIENKTGNLPNINSNKHCEKFTLLICDYFDCPDCDSKDCNRSKHEVKKDIKLTMLDILKEFYSFGLYECTEEVEGEEVSYYAWMSSGEYNWTIENCPEIKCKAKCKSLRNLFKSFDIPLNEWQNNNKVGFTADFTLCACFDNNTQFEYSKEEEIKKIGITKCSSCG